MEDYHVIDYGICNFVRSRQDAKAEYLRVAENIDARTLLRFMTKQWRLVRRAQLSNAASPARRKKNDAPRSAGSLRRTHPASSSV